MRDLVQVAHALREARLSGDKAEVHRLGLVLVGKRLVLKGSQRSYKVAGVGFHEDVNCPGVVSLVGIGVVHTTDIDWAATKLIQPSGRELTEWLQ